MSGLAIALRQKNFAKYDILLKSVFKVENSGLRRLLGIPAGISLSGELGGLSRLIVDSLTETDGKFYHVEFQSKNDKNMPWRMLAYYHRIMEDHLQNTINPGQKRVHQTVLYVGQDALSMDSKIRQDRIGFYFNLRDIRSFDRFSENLLSSRNPQDWIVGLLCKESVYPEAWDEIARRLQRLRHQDNWFWREMPAMFLIAGILREVSTEDMGKWENMLEVNIEKSEIFRQVYDQGAVNCLRDAIDDRLEYLGVAVKDPAISQKLESLDLPALSLLAKRLNRVSDAGEAYSAIFEEVDRSLEP